MYVHIALFKYFYLHLEPVSTKLTASFVSVIIFLIIIGILVAGGFLAGFIWAVKSGQYDDTYSPSVRMLFDDAKPPKKKTLTRKKRTHSLTM